MKKTLITILLFAAVGAVQVRADIQDPKKQNDPKKTDQQKKERSKKKKDKIVDEKISVADEAQPKSKSSNPKQK